METQTAEYTLATEVVGRLKRQSGKSLHSVKTLESDQQTSVFKELRGPV